METKSFLFSFQPIRIESIGLPKHRMSYNIHKYFVILEYELNSIFYPEKFAAKFIITK